MKTSNPTEKIEKYTNAKELVRDMKKGKLNNKFVWLDERQAQLSQRQEDEKEFVEFLEKLDIFVRGKIRIGATEPAIGLMNNNLGLIRKDIQQKLAELKQEINNG